MPGSGWFAPTRPRILAHRGLHVGAPENSLAAFRAAVDAGAEYVESDVRASRDGIAMLVHDADLERVLGGSAAGGRSVADLDAVELSALDLGDGVGVPRLDEVLRLLPATRFNLDVKSLDAAEPTARAVAEADARDRVLLTSFSLERRRAAVRSLPGVASSASSPEVVGAVVAHLLRSPRLARLVLRGVGALQIPRHRGRLRLDTPAFIRTMHRAGVEVHYWTIDDPGAMAELLARGADGIVTDRYDLARRVVEEHSAVGR